jgi:hypothetical protein
MDALQTGSVTQPNPQALIREWSSEFKRAPDGSYTISVRGLARLCGVVISTLSEQFQGDRENPSKLLKSLAAQGICPDRLAEQASAGAIPDTVATLVMQYYAFESKAANDTAKAVVSAFQVVGFRKYIAECFGEASDTARASNGYSQALMDQKFILEEAFPVIKKLLMGAGLSEERATGHLVRRAQYAAPLLAPALEGADRLVEAEIDDNLHNPTELWGMFKTSYTRQQLETLYEYLGMPRKIGPALVNQLLTLAQLQKPSDDPVQKWKLTKHGHEYGVVRLGPLRNQQNVDGAFVRWYPRVLDIINATAGRILLEIGEV